MNKVWNWIRDKKTNTIRKWRSTVFGGGGTTFEGGGTRYYSELDVPESRLKPIGGSDNALARSQTEKLFRKQTRTPTIKKNKPRSESTHSNGQLEPLLMRESISEVCFTV
uniref:Uncharacterized protein n=1 Tax=Panagrolaimus sp. PS1159 TaxID=55785 RepID=A0AC35FUX8_9BILA